MSGKTFAASIRWNLREQRYAASETPVHTFRRLLLLLFFLFLYIYIFFYSLISPLTFCFTRRTREGYVFLSDESSRVCRFGGETEYCLPLFWLAFSPGKDLYLVATPFATLKEGGDHGGNCGNGDIFAFCWLSGGFSEFLALPPQKQQQQKTK